MNHMRSFQYKGKGGGSEVHNVEQAPTGNPPVISQGPGSHLNNLEAKGGWRRMLSNIEVSNRFKTVGERQEHKQPHGC